MLEKDGKTPPVEEVQETATAQQEQSDDLQFTPEYVKELRQEAAANRVRAKELADKLAEIEAKNAEAERKRLEKQGEFEALYQQANEAAALKGSELEKAQAEIEAQTAVLQSLYEAQSKDAPDYIKELLENMPLVNRLEWIAKNNDKLNRNTQGTPKRDKSSMRPDPAKVDKWASVFKNPL